MWQKQKQKFYRNVIETRIQIREFFLIFIFVESTCISYLLKLYHLTLPHLTPLSIISEMFA